MDWSGVDYLWIIVLSLSDVWALILTAPIHYRAVVSNPAPGDFSSNPNQTHLN